MKTKLLLVAAMAAVLLSGCASSLTSSAYSRGQVRQAMSVSVGTVENIRAVKIEGTSSGQGLSVGSTAGGVIGAIAGSNLGGGKGSWIASVLGAVAGGVAGAAVEQGVTAKDGIEVTVRLEGGRLIAVTQEADPKESFAVGDKVQVLDGGGVTRVIKASVAARAANL